MHSSAFQNVSCRLHQGVLPLGARASMASQIAQNALTKGIWEANGDIGVWPGGMDGLAKLVLAMRWLCGGAGLKAFVHAASNPNTDQRGKAHKIPNPRFP